MEVRQGEHAPRLIWIVLDQSVTFNLHRRFIEALAQPIHPNVAVRVVSMHKDDMKAAKVGAVKVRLRGEHRNVPLANASPRDPLILFRDSECRDRAHLEREQQDMDRLVEDLRAVHPNATGVVFNPMSEGAYLLFERALDPLCEITRCRRTDLERLARDRARGEFVNKDRLDGLLALHNGLTKRKVDHRIPDFLFRDGVPDCDAAPFLAVRARIEGVLRQGLG